jgi:DUF1680 family protein
MKSSFTRRGFLSSVAAAGCAALIEPHAVAEPSAKVSESAAASAVTPKIAWKAQPFPLTQVRLLPSPWLNMMELNRSYLYSLPNDRLAHNFRVTAGLASEATPLGGWEAPDCELRGHYVGHYLSACALMHATTGDLPLRDKASDLVAILAECQAKDGYLGAYPANFYDRLRKHEEVWAPFYTYHKILAGMIDMHQHAGNAQALSVAERMADWAIAYSAPISADEWQKVLLTEQGGMNEASFNLYAITGKEKYRDLAYRFEHHKIFDPLAAGDDKLGGNHANTNIPKVIGAARGYELTGDERYNRVSRNFYRAVVDHHTYATGGTSNGEFWHKPDGIASELGASAQECCCSYNMMKLTRHLFSQEPDAAHFDYYERMLYNVRSGTQDRNGMLMYYVSLAPGMYKTFGTPFDAFWCCTGTGSEEYSKLTDSIYFHDDKAVYVNLYIPSRLDWKERGLVLQQTSKFPLEEKIAFRVVSAPTEPVALKLRIPYWATKDVAIRINGALQTVPSGPSTYATLEHAWQAGDTLELVLPMSLHIAPANDDPKVQAAMYGPLALAVLLGTEGLTNGMIYGKLGPNDPEYATPLPEVAEGGEWLEQIEAAGGYSLRFRSKGRGPKHVLVPISQISDERYSVYVRNVSA